MTEAAGDDVRRGWPGARRVGALVVLVVLAWSGWVSARVAVTPSAERTWGASTDEVLRVVQADGTSCDETLETPSPSEAPHAALAAPR